MRPISCVFNLVKIAHISLKKLKNIVISTHHSSYSEYYITYSFFLGGGTYMYQHIKTTLAQLTLEELETINIKNDLRIHAEELQRFHDLLSTQWNDIIDEPSLSLNSDRLRHRLQTTNVSKFNELITSIKKNIIFNKK